MCDQKTACIDIETSGLSWPSSVLTVGVSYRNGDGSIHEKSWVASNGDLFHDPTPIPQIRSELLPIIQQADLVIGHNMVFDLSRLFKLGVLVPDDIRGKLFDTLLVARMTGSHESHSLDALCAEQKIGTDEWRSMKDKRKNMLKVGVENRLKYNTEDTTNNLLLGEALYDHGKTIYDHSFMVSESEFCRVTAEMQLRGQVLDPDKTYNLIRETRKKRTEVMTNYLWSNRIEGPNNNKDLVKWLKGRGVTNFTLTDHGNISLDESSIDTLIYDLTTECDPVLDDSGNMIPIEVYYDPRKKRVQRDLPQPIKEIVDVLDAVLACRGWDKAIGTWLEPLVLEHATEDGLVHANYSVAGAASYRYSCSSPGLQAFPKLDIWGPKITADFSQAEYRLLALYVGYMTGNFSLAEAYDKGFDAHTVTAMQLFGSETITKEQRAFGKTMNFAMNYGAGPNRLASQMGVSFEEAKAFYTLYQQKMKSAFDVSRQVNDLWVKRGYIKLWSGKRIWRNRHTSDYIGWNQLMQGGVAEITKEAMMSCDRHGIPLIGQVHDAIEFPVDIDQEIAYDCMISALPEEVRNWTTPSIQMKVDGFPFLEKIQ